MKGGLGLEDEWDLESLGGQGKLLLRVEERCWPDDALLRVFILRSVQYCLFAIPRCLRF